MEMEKPVTEKIRHSYISLSISMFRLKIFGCVATQTSLSLTKPTLMGQILANFAVSGLFTLLNSVQLKFPLKFAVESVI